MQMTSGWWILPAAIGGLVFWITLAVYAPEWFAVMLREAALSQSRVIEVSRGDFHAVGRVTVANVKAEDVAFAGDAEFKKY